MTDDVIHVCTFYVHYAWYAVFCFVLCCMKNNNDCMSGIFLIFFFLESDLSESIYAPIYGRLPLPMRNPNTFAPQARTAYVGEWE